MNTLTIGSKGDDVKYLQKSLNDIIHCGITVDGQFGINTDKALKTFQKLHNLKADGICGPATWSVIQSILDTFKDINTSTNTMEQPNIIPHSYKFTNKLGKRNKTTEIVLHCASTPEGKDFTVDQIHKWHLDRGFSGIGYNFVIYRDGTIVEGRPIDCSGAHATNHNSISVGICYIGGTGLDGHSKDTRTAEQKKSMYILVKWLMDKYKIQLNKVLMHRDITVPKPNMKSCPCFTKQQFDNEFLTFIK